MLGGGDGEAFLTFILAMLQPVTELPWKPRVQGGGHCRLEAARPDTCLAAHEGRAWDPGLHRRSRQKLPESHPAPHSLAAGLVPGLLI